MPAIPSGSYRFGEFELQPDERLLLVAGEPVRVGRNAFELLLALVERSGHLVSKDQLLDLVWPNLVVEENTLQANVSALRKILGSDAIATVSGRGYRFVRDVTRLDSPPQKPTIKHNLQSPLTSFIGRETQVAELNHLLRISRLVVLVGAGGCGKTRLAIQVTLQDAHRYSEGAWLVELSTISDPSLLPQAVARAFGVRERVGKTFTEALVEHVGTKRLLLLLDNAEHVLSSCGQLVDTLLRRCEQLVVLVTSRERLGLSSELTYRIPSLAVPAKQRVKPEQIEDIESVRLFVERARIQRPHFAVTAENASAVASICRQLDGIPLAIELAAPRVKSMSVHELEERLDQRFSLLTGGSPAALPRHRRLRSLIDWSYDLLGDAERTLLNRVSVFAGGWTLGTAESVCADGEIVRRDVLDLLASLVDKSLLVADERDGATRYGLLETVRHYAREQLHDVGGEAHMQRRHFDCFLTLAEEAEPHLKRADQQSWFERLDAEHGNVRAALSWSTAPEGDAAGGLRLASAVSWFWYQRGYPLEGQSWISALLTTIDGRADPATLAKALSSVGVLAFSRADYSAARTFHEESLRINRQLADRQGVVRALNNLALVAADLGEYASARQLSEEGLAIQRDLGGDAQIVILLTNLGTAVFEQGDHAEARRLIEEALAIQREIGDPSGIALLLANLGTVARAQKDYSAARQLLEESVSIRRAMGSMAMAFSLGMLGRVFCAQGDHVAARKALKEALEIHRQGDQRRWIAAALEAMGAVARVSTGYDSAARLWGGAEKLREDISAPIEPSELTEYNRDVSAARAAENGTATFEAAWQAGRAMSLEALVQFALDCCEDVPGHPPY